MILTTTRCGRVKAAVIPPLFCPKVMNLRSTTALAALGCVLLASCTPYNESRYRHPRHDHRRSTVTSPNQQKIQEQRDQLKKNEERKKVEEIKKQPVQESISPPPNETPKPPVVEKRDYPVATQVPGREGMVISPYNNKMIDVSGMPSGQLVADPTYPADAKKYFRVP
jgi:hypothetical protein